MVTEMAEQPVNSPSKAYPNDQRRNQLGGEAECDARLVRRRTFGPLGLPRLKFVEPLAQVTESVGVWSRHTVSQA